MGDGIVNDADRLAGNPGARRIPIPGTENLRDVGGYRTADGSEVSRRHLYRAEGLIKPGGPKQYSFYDSEYDEKYRDLGVRTVIDLRAEKEATRAPSAWAIATGGRLLTFPIAEGGEGADTNFVGMLVNGQLERFDAVDMGRFYIHLLEKRSDVFGSAFRALAEADGIPALVHCAAGKDRTGVFIALVLSLLGVSHEDVARDYSLTDVYRPNRIDAYAHLFVEAGRDPEIARALFESPYDAMITMLDHLDQHHGGANGYLREMAGIDDDVVLHLKSRLLRS
mgnify:CR=1 FL=1